MSGEGTMDLRERIAKAIVDGAMAWNDANQAAGRCVAPYSEFVADAVLAVLRGDAEIVLAVSYEDALTIDGALGDLAGQLAIDGQPRRAAEVDALKARVKAAHMACIATGGR